METVTTQPVEQEVEEIEVKAVGENIPRINIALLNLPKAVHRAWKVLSAVRGITMKDSLREALELWIRDQGSKLNLKDL